MTRFKNLLAVFIFLVSVSASLSCWSQQDEFDDFDLFDEAISTPSVEIYDPFESFNRKVFAFNDFADQYVVGYVIDGYRAVTNKPVRSSISNFFNNLFSPFVIINSLLQGKFDNSVATFSSFIINSTVGIFGLFDVASSESVIYQDEDFGQTLGYYGIGTGPYLVLPFLGPSTARDLLGIAITRLSSPTSFDIFKFRESISLNLSSGNLIALNSIDLLSKKERYQDILQDIKLSSFDYYSSVRSYYLQNRNSNINK